MAVDAEALQTALKQVTTTGPTTYLAARQIAMWKAGDVIDPNMDDKEAIRLYLGLKEVNGRVTASMFKEWKQTLSTATTVKRRIYLVPRNNPSIDIESFSDFLVPISTVDPPDGIDVEDYYFVDAGVDRARLGKGVLELEVSVRSTRSKRIPSSFSPASSAAPTPHKVLPVADESVDRKATPPRQRTLKREDTVEDSTAAEDIAQHTKELFEQSLLVGGQTNQRTVLFWMGEMLKHIRGLSRRCEDKDTFLEQLDEYCVMYYRFCTKRILDVDDLDSARKLSGVLDEVRTEFPKLLSPVGTVIVKLLKGESFEEELLEVNLATRTELYRSNLFSAWRKDSIKAQYTKLLDKSKQASLTVDDITELLAQGVEDPYKSKLEFMKGYLSVAESETLKFLCDGGLEACQALEEFNLEGERLCVAPFFGFLRGVEEHQRGRHNQGVLYIDGSEIGQQLCEPNCGKGLAGVRGREAVVEGGRWRRVQEGMHRAFGRALCQQAGDSCQRNRCVG